MKMTNFIGGAIRADKTGKTRYHLIPLEMIDRLAKTYMEGGDLHGDDNWRRGDIEFMMNCKHSAWRHFMSWQKDQDDEDHAMKLVWNIFAYEYLKNKITNQ